MIRVAFILNDYQVQWKGGLNYYRSLINAICESPENRISPVVITGPKIDKSALNGFPDIEIIESSIFQRGSFSWFIQRSMDNLFSRDVMIERLLRSHRIDLLSHANYSLNMHSSLPMCTWIPDFQITQMPEFFSESEITELKSHFIRLCKRSVRIILSSYDAQKHLHSLAPEFVSKSSVLQFVARPLFENERTSIEQLQQKYNFRGPYFLVPNQFWMHKNHKVIIEALALLRAENKNLLILATGKQYDHRHPNYNNELMKLIADNNLANDFRPLGAIPYADLSGLMIHSISMINPSFFEGWSTSVEEAKSLGKHMILSDIPVHREQAPPDAEFFDPHIAEQLKNILWNRLDNYDPQDDQVRRLCAQKIFPARWDAFAKTYTNIVTDALG